MIDSNGCIFRDENFSVSDVTESDVIHASPKDIPCIFRITTSMIGEGLQLFTQLMLVDKETEKHKWIDALRELHRIIRRNNIPTRNVCLLWLAAKVFC